MTDQQTAENTPPRRLHLHIPNSHPRATSPRGSPLSASPVSNHISSRSPKSSGIHNRDDSVVEADLLPQTVRPTYGSVLQGVAHRNSEEAIVLLQPNRRQRSWWRYFQVDTTSGESSRDFLARERTYFSWLRLATFLAIASVALFLRLRLRIFTTDEEVGSTTTSYGIASTTTTSTKDLTHMYARAMVKRALRKRQLVKLANLVQDSSPSSSSQIILSSLSNGSKGDDKDGEDGSLLRTNPYFSKVLGSFFFVLAVVALVVGHIDYMRCERALEKADRLITPSNHDGDPDDHLVRLHNAHSAKRAHSNFLVHAVEIIIALAIFATALIILVTVTQGQLEPIPPR